MSRRLAAWLTLPLAALGSQLAHDLAYRIVVRDPHERAHLLAETGHAYLAYAPLAGGVCAGLAAAGLAACTLDRLRRGRSGRLAAAPFAAVALVVFVVQEHVERLLHGHLSATTATEPTFLVGVALQFPVAVLAYLLARALLRAADRVLRAFLADAPRLGVPLAGILVPASVFEGPRLGRLAAGRPVRGPPPRA